jgi:hypothetical protein
MIAIRHVSFRDSLLVAGGLDPLRVLRALAHPVLGAELHALGVRDLTGFGIDNAEVDFPPEHESYIRERIAAALGDDAGPPAWTVSTSKRGRREGKVSIYEANLAAAIYVKDRAEFDARNDGGAYAVHKLYSEDREPSSTLLSRPMVGHLLNAIRAGWLPWDAREEHLRISDEFRTSKAQFRIPRLGSRS